MIDFDLQMRFWRNFSEALFHSADASLAAAGAWQNEILDAGTDTKVNTKAAAASTPMIYWPWMNATPQMPPLASLDWTKLWWLGPAAPANPFLAMMPSLNPMFSAGSGPMSGMAASPYQSLFASFFPWSTLATKNMPRAGLMGFPMTAAQTPMAQMMNPFWPWPTMTWAYMQMPLTAMMMQAGMPYAVACPSAKASTAAMDAADAARQQMEKVYSAYRSDGGHAAAQLITMPWTLAASFMTASQPSASTELKAPPVTSKM